MIGEVGCYLPDAHSPRARAGCPWRKGYVIDSALLEKMKPDALILHPLPALSNWTSQWMTIRVRFTSGRRQMAYMYEWRYSRCCWTGIHNQHSRRNCMPVMDASHTQELIELEENYGAHNYHPLDVVIERAEGVWVIRHRRQALSGLPGFVFGSQSGALPSPHSRNPDRAGAQSHTNLTCVPQ